MVQGAQEPGQEFSDCIHSIPPKPVAESLNLNPEAHFPLDTPQYPCQQKPTTLEAQDQTLKSFETLERALPVVYLAVPFLVLTFLPRILFGNPKTSYNGNYLTVTSTNFLNTILDLRSIRFWGLPSHGRSVSANNPPTFAGEKGSSARASSLFL